ncbi:DUF5134 domain-containing protein [Mycobacterium riyadhense]|uniref:DUF5134 domain-containing protein n=1 Tax=Mycobacterium riyadhense TaxID=486698 RepID=A0A653F3D7_9MYCO|nr:DUF5134 domain-containing protein [Mycobacterium riyadhense]VTP03536.1 hypothetical protein BIN_B_05127 [Mycobacterium riyadhense]
MIADLPLRWLLTGLFLLSAAGFVLVIDRRSWTSIVGHGLHVAMAIAMAVMAWPRAVPLPATLPALFFLAAGVWFVVMAAAAARRIAQRVVRGYHAATMAAMAWMYAAMNRHVPTDRPLAEHHMPPGMSMPDLDMTATNTPTGSALPGWIATGNWIWTVFFVLAALVWGFRLVTQRGSGRGTRASRKSLACAVEAMMAAGVATMFATMLFAT